MTKQSTHHETVRLTDQTRDRLRAFAKSRGVSVSAAHRILLERGISEFERDARDAATPRASVRRVLSRGAG
jgi:hypothetical protein